MNTHKILHISDSFPSLHNIFGGAEIIAKRLVDLFAASGWRQGLLVSGGKNIKNKIDNVELFPFETIEDILPDEKWITALKSQLYPSDPFAVRALLKTLNTYKPHVVLIHTIRHFTLQVAEICSQMGVPVYLMVYDYIHFCPTGMFVDQDGNLCRSPGEKCILCHSTQAKELNKWSEKLLNIRKFFFYPLLDSIDKFIVLSEASKKLLSDTGIDKNKIVVIKQPLEFERKVTYGNPNHILFIGWGQQRKGLLVVAKALKKLKKPFTFEAIGALVDERYVDQVRDELRASGLNPTICLRGRLSNNEVSIAMKKAGIVVVAEQWENMSPVVLHEAMSAGKVVVAGSIGGIPEFISDGKNGFLTKFNDPSSYAQKINHILGDGEKQRKIGKNAITSAKRNTNPLQTLRKFNKIFKYSTANTINEKLKAWLSGCYCVIVCGGNGSRLNGLNNKNPKSLLEINAKPLIGYIIDYWTPYTDRFILITNYRSDRIKEYVESIPYNIKVIEEKGKGKGVAGALLEAEKRLKGRFLMVLGDCLYTGQVRFADGMDRGIGVFPNASPELIRENFSLEIDRGMVRKLNEKPSEIKNKLCGMGVYFMDGSIWRAIRDTKPDKNNKIQITSVMQTLSDTVGLFPVYFDGGYVNVNYPKDIAKAEQLIHKQMQSTKS